MDILEKLGSRIREERKKANLTQENLAELLDLSVAYIGYIERGKQAPYLKTLERIAKAMNIEVYELFIFDDTEGEDREVAIHELINTLKDSSPDDIRFISSILQQILERMKSQS